MEPEDSLSPSQHQPHPRCLIHFNIILKLTPRSYDKWSRHSIKTLYSFLSPRTATFLPIATLFITLPPHPHIPSHCHPFITLPRTPTSPPTATPPPSFLISKNICWRAQNHEAPRYVVFTTPLSPRPSQPQIPPSAPYSQTPSAYSQRIKNSLLLLSVTQPFMWMITGCWKVTLLFGRPVPNISRDSRQQVHSFIPKEKT